MARKSHAPCSRGQRFLAERLGNARIAHRGRPRRRVRAPVRIVSSLTCRPAGCTRAKPFARNLPISKLSTFSLRWRLSTNNPRARRLRRRAWLENFSWLRIPHHAVVDLAETERDDVEGIVLVQPPRPFGSTGSTCPCLKARIPKFTVFSGLPARACAYKRRDQRFLARQTHVGHFRMGIGQESRQFRVGLVTRGGGERRDIGVGLLLVIRDNMAGRAPAPRDLLALPDVGDQRRG